MGSNSWVCLTIFISHFALKLSCMFFFFKYCYDKGTTSFLYATGECHMASCPSIRSMYASSNHKTEKIMKTFTHMNTVVDAEGERRTWIYVSPVILFFFFDYFSFLTVVVAYYTIHIVILFNGTTVGMWYSECVRCLMYFCCSRIYCYQIFVIKCTEISLKRVKNVEKGFLVHHIFTLF